MVKRTFHVVSINVYNIISTCNNYTISIYYLFIYLKNECWEGPKLMFQILEVWQLKIYILQKSKPIFTHFNIPKLMVSNLER